MLECLIIMHVIVMVMHILSCYCEHGNTMIDMHCVVKWLDYMHAC